MAASPGASADRPGHRQSLLAGSLWDRARAHGGRLRRQRRVPSHPELLDWLAVEFRESGWDVKRFFRLMVTSATYRQSAQVTPRRSRTIRKSAPFTWTPIPDGCRDDPRLRPGRQQSPRQKMGGPSVKPYQPDGVWEAVAMPESNTRDLPARQGRESLSPQPLHILETSRSAASMDIFNAPSREFCTVRRERTNTPLAGPCDAERSAVHRGRPQPGPAP